MVILNDQTVHTRIDLLMVTPNVKNIVISFKVDIRKRLTPHGLKYTKGQKPSKGKYTDHREIKTVVAPKVVELINVYPDVN